MVHFKDSFTVFWFFENMYLKIIKQLDFISTLRVYMAECNFSLAKQVLKCQRYGGGWLPGCSEVHLCVFRANNWKCEFRNFSDVPCSLNMHVSRVIYQLSINKWSSEYQNPESAARNVFPVPHRISTTASVQLSALARAPLEKQPCEGERMKWEGLRDVGNVKEDYSNTIWRNHREEGQFLSVGRNKHSPTSESLLLECIPVYLESIKLHK